jgi:hypothetical protein
MVRRCQRLRPSGGYEAAPCPRVGGQKLWPGGQNFGHSGPNSVHPGKKMGSAHREFGSQGRSSEGRGGRAGDPIRPSRGAGKGADLEFSSWRLPRLESEMWLRATTPTAAARMTARATFHVRCGGRRQKRGAVGASTKRSSWCSGHDGPDRKAALHRRHRAARPSELPRCHHDGDHGERAREGDGTFLPRDARRVGVVLVTPIGAT